MVTSRTQSHANLIADAVHNQVTGMGTLDHEVCCLLQVVLTTSVFMMVVDGCCKLPKQPLFLGIVRTGWHVAKQLHQTSWCFHLLEFVEYRRSLILERHLILKISIHDLLNVIKSSSIGVFRYAKPDLLHEAEGYRTVHDDVATVRNSSL